MAERLNLSMPAVESALDRRGFMLRALAGGLGGVQGRIGETATRIRLGAAVLKPSAEGHDPCLSPRGPRRFTPTRRKE